MCPVRRHEQWIQRGAWWFLVLAAAGGGFLIRAAMRLPDAVPPPAEPAAAPRLPDPAPVASLDWSLVRTHGGAPLEAGRFSKRFRLAGTYFEYPQGGADIRKAILDDLTNKVQRIVAEGDRLADVDIVRVLGDRVVLRDPLGEEELLLSFSGGAGDSRGGEAAPVAAAGKAARFGGRQLGTNRWVFSRQALIDYYAELREEPERLVKVFDSLKPLYNEAGKIGGYQLGMEGEREFFEAAGLKEGDVVRKVNSMPMTRRARAEYFLGEFVNNRLNVFAIEVERNGRSEKMIYELR